MKNNINNVKIIDLPTYDNSLTVIESKNLPIMVKRLFIINGNKNEKRGKHAHIKLSQYLICTSGKCDVMCDDGKQQIHFKLSTSSQALLIPPGIWAEQTYLEKGTTLLVACDALYDEADYIRDYGEFLKVRNSTYSYLPFK